MQQHEGEREPPIGFDVTRIAANMQGWQLDQLKGRDNWWHIIRGTPDGGRLFLELNPSERYVHFSEYDGQRLHPVFEISCRDIGFVDISGGSIKFRGNVHYIISYNGQFHDVSIPATSSEEQSISLSKNYEFKD